MINQSPFSEKLDCKDHLNGPVFTLLQCNDDLKAKKKQNRRTNDGRSFIDNI